MYEVYSIDTKIINIDRSHNLEKRTKAPLRLHRAVSLATKLERKGHVTMIEKVSPAAGETVLWDSYQKTKRPQRPPFKAFEELYKVIREIFFGKILTR